MQLIAGQNVPLAGATVQVRLQQSGRAPADVVALLLDDRGRVKGDTDFVFYNAPRHPSGSVTLTELGLSLDLRLVPAGAERVIVAANGDGDSQLDHLTVLVESDEMLTFAPSGVAGLPTVVLVEVYRRGDGWRVRAVGQGWAAGLAGLAWPSMGLTSMLRRSPISRPPRRSRRCLNRTWSPCSRNWSG